MKLIDVLKKYNFSPAIIKIFESSGIENLHPPQAEAIEQGVLDGKNLLMSVPTAAGKTLIAELTMLKRISQDNALCLYIAPLKALASEKFNDFKKKYEPLGIKVALAIGDADTPVKSLNENNIIVATAEKIDSLLRSKAPWLVEAASVVVLDEIHFINDGERGPTQEILTARLKQLNPKIQFLGLSATVSNAQEMADWLGANLVLSSWRPIPLKEGVYHNGRIEFEEYGIRQIVEDARDDLSKLTLDTLRDKGQVLIFVNSRRSAQAVSRQITKAVSSVLTETEKQQLYIIAKKIRGSETDATQICIKLSEAVKNGSAFHHAGLKSRQRELVEENFKKNLIKVISCTPTLAAGVNLPARRAIIRDCKRFESGLGQAYIPVSEYKQCAGRAGRPQYDTYGEAVIIAKSDSESVTLFDRYINAETEPIISKLDRESALRIHVLASIAGGYVHDIKGMLEFFSHTFLHHQDTSGDLFDSIHSIFDFLHNQKFIEKSGERFFATPIGSLTSRLYIDPMTSIVIRDGLEKLNEKKSFSPIGILHMLMCTADSVLTRSVAKAFVESVEMFGTQFYDEFILTPENYPGIDEYFHYMATLKTTWLLSDWIEEEREDNLCEKFSVGPGDIYRHVESTGWLLYAASRIAEQMHYQDISFHLANLKTRVRYGVKDQLLDIISLKGVGRIRARQLYNNNIHKISDIPKISVGHLAKIPTIGNALANKLMLQASRPTASFSRPIPAGKIELATTQSEENQDWDE